jgi:O-antigen/teichoic acid export membrane protein
MVGVLRRVQANSLVRNSFYLMLTTVTMAAAGFGFWVSNARLFSENDVGHATVLVAATSFLAYLSLAGTNITVVRHLATATDPSRIVSTAVSTVTLASAVFAVGYVALVPLVAPALADLLLQPAVAGAFVLLVVGSSVNLFTDAVFVANRSAGWNFVIDGLLLGAGKLTLPLVLVGLGSFGIFVASAGASTIAAVVSLLVCHYRLGLNLRPRIDRAVLKETWSYSASNYLANCLNLLPTLVMPLVMLRSSGAKATAGFFIAFQIATIFYSIAYATCDAMFAESSQRGAALRHNAIRALALMYGLLVPAITVAILAARPILAVFGPTYQDSAAPPLVALSLAALSVAVYAWGHSLLKITGQVVGVVVVNLGFAATIIGLALLWAPRGGVWVAAAWGVGHLVGAVLAVGFVLWGRR